MKALLLEARVEEGYVWRAVAGGMIFNKAKRVFKRKSVTIGLDVGDDAPPPPFFQIFERKIINEEYSLIKPLLCGCSKFFFFAPLNGSVW